MSVLRETVQEQNAGERVAEFFLGMRQRLRIAPAMLSGPPVQMVIPLSPEVGR